MNQQQVGNFLNRLYRDETITLILEEAINGRYQITFIIDGRPEQERTLSKSDLSAIRKAGFDEKPAIIEIEPLSSMWKNGRITIASVGKKQSVCYRDLRVGDNTLEQITKQFGHGDKELKTDSNEFHIAPLTSKEIEDRTQEIIRLHSLEKRDKAIMERGFEIYAELRKRYPEVVTFRKEAIAQFIQREEKLIYQSLEKDLPSVSSYVKHTKTFSDPIV